MFTRIPFAWAGAGKPGCFSFFSGYTDSINPIITLIFGLPMAGRCFPEIDDIGQLTPPYIYYEEDNISIGGKI
jgi:hypothetical protein